MTLPFSSKYTDRRCHTDCQDSCSHVCAILQSSEANRAGSRPSMRKTKIKMTISQRRGTLFRQIQIEGALRGRQVGPKLAVKRALEDTAAAAMPQPLSKASKEILRTRTAYAQGYATLDIHRFRCSRRCDHSSQ